MKKTKCKGKVLTPEMNFKWHLITKLCEIADTRFGQKQGISLVIDEPIPADLDKGTGDKVKAYIVAALLQADGPDSELAVKQIVKEFQRAYKEYKRLTEGDDEAE